MYAPLQKQNKAAAKTSSQGVARANRQPASQLEHLSAGLQSPRENQAPTKTAHASPGGAGIRPTDGGNHFRHNFADIPVFHRPVRGLQAKLTVNVPGDAYEQEADRIAEQVMRMPESQAAPATQVLSHAAGVQRECACGGTCDDCKKKNHDEEHAKVQMKAAGPVNAGGMEAPPIVHEVLRSSGQPLDAVTRAFMEPRFGHDFSKVRVHADEKAAESARAVGARAYTVGSNVVFGAGEYVPRSQAGQRLLGHELTHVVQQGRGKYIIQRSPAPNRPPTSLEIGEIDIRETDCKYQPEERKKSQTTRGILDPDVAFANYYNIHDSDPSAVIIADFVVDDADVRSSTMAELRSHSWIDNWERSATPLEIVGYSDCAGWESRNSKLREDRAQAVARLLSKAKAQLKFVGGAPFSEHLGDSQSPEGRALSRSVIVRNPDPPKPVPVPPKKPQASPHGKIEFDGKTVTTRKNGFSITCPAITSASDPTPEGIFCVRRQGETQREPSILHPLRDHSDWYLLEPQFETKRYRMDLHPGSVSKGCVTVTNSDCFKKMSGLLNSPGTTTGKGYDGYPPGNDEGVNNPSKTVDCVAELRVKY